MTEFLVVLNILRLCLEVKKDHLQQIHLVVLFSIHSAGLGGSCWGGLGS